MTRYVPNQVIANDPLPDDRRAKHRDWWLRKRCDNLMQSNDVLNELVKAQRKRWLQMTEGARRIELVLQSRLIVGLGGKGSLEIGITLDHVTGLPYIPGSAIKGAVRNYHLLKLAEQQGIYLQDPGQIEAFNKELEKFEEQLENPENTAPEAETFRRWFGTQGNAGGLIFYDAVLYKISGAQNHLFVVDVMTPHFKTYYGSSGRSAPTDSDSPNPISFIAVEVGNTFAFAVGPRRGARLQNDDLDKALAVLFEAVTTTGIGAKTAAGYGWFVEPKRR
ncbi:MAG: type III-B CRISPR module RAMP protein Cmr6 [Anaerolinea sp.]|nr:type III-B CRISPR module RAMP protein Cmr6 [Anaerolinea sp.]